MMSDTLDLRSQVHLITGATSGIGLETARALARCGATVVVAARDEEKARRLVAELRAETGNHAIDYLLANLTVQAEVRRLAAEFRARYDRLDVLINNAGGLYWSRQKSADAIDKTFALNHLAPFLLTNLFLDLLQASAPARVINVSSDMHRVAQLDLDHLAVETGYKAYARSKLALVLFTYELARRLEGTGVTAVALHPGFVATGIGMNHPWLKIFKWVVKLSAASPEQGAETTVYLASSPDVAGQTGLYFRDKQPVRSAAASYDLETARRLWDLSARMTGLNQEEPS